MSLTALGLVIKALTDGKGHIPFRDSKLTLLLKDALGGNSKTTLVCTASKQLRHLEESIQTLQFAERAKRIKNKAAANVMRSPEEMAKMIEKLKAEVMALKLQLTSNGLTPLSGANLKELEAKAAAEEVKAAEVKAEEVKKEDDVKESLPEEDTSKQTAPSNEESNSTIS